MVYPMDKQQICFALGGDIMKFVISLIKWIISIVKKEKPKELHIQSVNSNITIIIHKD